MATTWFVCLAETMIAVIVPVAHVRAPARFAGGTNRSFFRKAATMTHGRSTTGSFMPGPMKLSLSWICVDQKSSCVSFGQFCKLVSFRSGRVKNGHIWST
jgi:hypothetical protein